MIAAAVLGALALWATAVAPAVPACDNKWGYVVKDATTCERGGEAWLAIIAGLGALAAVFGVITNGRAVIRNRETRSLTRMFGF